jgi:hypothetical protein
VTLINAPTQGVEQAITPGETWEMNQLNFMLGRSVNQATSFRFLHLYLYEPWPATGQYWLSETSGTTPTPNCGGRPTSRSSTTRTSFSPVSGP